jgi:hypothetical protein
LDAVGIIIVKKMLAIAELENLMMNDEDDTDTDSYEYQYSELYKRQQRRQPGVGSTAASKERINNCETASQCRDRCAW